MKNLLLFIVSLGGFMYAQSDRVGSSPLGTSRLAANYHGVHKVHRHYVRGGYQGWFDSQRYDNNDREDYDPYYPYYDDDFPYEEKAD